MSDTLLLHRRFHLRRRGTRLIARRAREGPLGDDRDAQLVGLVATDGTCGFHLITHVTVGCGKVNCPQGKRRCPGVQPRRTASDENHIANYHGHHFYIISIERGTLTPPSANYLYHCNRRGAHCAPTVSLNGYGHSSMHRFHSHCGSTLCSPAITHLQMVKNGIMRSCRPAI